MEADHSELIAQFVSITDGSAADAEHLLEASGWDLGQAMQLYFDTKTHEPPVASPAQVNEVPDFPQVAPVAAANDWASQAPAQPTLDEFGVRVPDSVRTERLVAGSMQPRVRIAGRSGGQMLHLPFSDPLENSSSRVGPGLDSVYPPPTAIMSELTLEECASIESLMLQCASSAVHCVWHASYRLCVVVAIVSSCLQIEAPGRDR